jgi:hypothetical protein
MSFSKTPFSITSFFRAVISLPVITFINVDHYCGRMMPDVGVVGSMIYIGSVNMAWTIVRIIVVVPVIMISVIVVPVMSSPWMPVNRIIPIMP